MRKILIFVLLTLHQATKAIEIECDKKVNFDSEKHCFLDRQASISSQGTRISPRDTSITALRLKFNKNILPERVGDQFPNLKKYIAHDCSVREVSKTNFEYLDKVYKLAISNNQIERIPSSTFVDMTALQQLNLGINSLQIFC